MQKIVPNLWFDNEAEDAAKFYVSLFKNARIIDTVLYPEAATEPSGKPAGSVLTVDFEIDGQRYVALNGGPEFKFNESVSFAVNCKDQAEIDYYWNALTKDGGEESMCGWLKDKFGLSWQIVPEKLDDMMRDPDQKKVEAVTAAFMPMKKLDIATLEKAYKEAA
jgi:predicted 3-demethylubiquinone-9 3-methyltransferase (glyoxalase superfamily)